jgi:hypothetical protein
VDRLRSAGRILELVNDFPAGRLERACARALYFGEPDYRTIRRILQTGKDQEHLPGIDPPQPVITKIYTFARNVGEVVSALKAVRS